MLTPFIKRKKKVIKQNNTPKITKKYLIAEIQRIAKERGCKEPLKSSMLQSHRLVYLQDMVNKMKGDKSKYRYKEEKDDLSGGVSDSNTPIHSSCSEYSEYSEYSEESEYSGYSDAETNIFNYETSETDLFKKPK